jgi:hypothetical protein
MREAGDAGVRHVFLPGFAVVPPGLIRSRGHVPTAEAVGYWRRSLRDHLNQGRRRALSLVKI